MTYAVHTDSATYLLDDEGICRWIISPNGLLPAASSSVVGAQFIACLDLRVPGGLVGELRVGAAALFVRPDDEGRIVMLRTAPISHVESRAEASDEEQPRSTRASSRPPAPKLPAPRPSAGKPPPPRPPAPKPPAPRRAAPSAPPAPPAPSGRGIIPRAPRSGPVMSTTSSVEETLTIVKPLYRPPPPAPREAREAPPEPVQRAAAGPLRGRPPPVPPPRSIVSPPVSSVGPPPPMPRTSRSKGTDPARARRR
jgi:hypothetical protein